MESILRFFLAICLQLNLIISLCPGFVHYSVRGIVVVTILLL